MAYRLETVVEHRLFCDKHNVRVSEQSGCPYCDLCVHGRTRYEHCRECNANNDDSWMFQPLSDSELRAVADHARFYPRREDPHRLRNYSFGLAIIDILIRDYRRLRDEALSHRTA